jgi:hypothetical protein
MKLRIQIRIGSKPAVPEEPPFFTTLVAPKRPSAWTFACSVAAHAVLISGMTAASKYWPQSDEIIDYSHYKIETIHLRLDDPIYFTASAAPVRPAPPKPAPAPRQGAEGRPESGDTAAPAPQAPVVPHRLELPVPHETARNAPVILQPDFNPRLTPPSTALPPLAFWARAMDAPKPPPREFVNPGRVEAPAPPPKLAAPPVLAVPNREPVVADVNISLPQAPPPPNASLPVQNSATIPVRLRDATETQAASFERQQGQAVNVLAISGERSDARQVNIPKGLQNIPRSATAEGPSGAAAEVRSGAGASDSQGTAASGAGNANQHAGNGPGNDQRAGAGSSGQSANSTSSSSGAGSAAGRPGGGTTASASGEKPNTPNSGNGAANVNNNNGGNGTRPNSSAAPPSTTAPAASPGAPNPVPEPVRADAHPPTNPSRDVTRIQHPTNGSFDVVIMQSATRDDLPDLGGMLSGNPVYTVYLRVGDRKEWLLEYCVPTGQTSQPNPYEIKVDDAGSITPPYPINTSIPNGILAASIPKHIVLRGTLTATGSIKGVKGTDGGNPIMPELVALLSEWRFRPALKDKKPIDVEILLVIPARV